MGILPDNSWSIASGGVDEAGVEQFVLVTVDAEANKSPHHMFHTSEPYTEPQLRELLIARGIDAGAIAAAFVAAKATPGERE